MGSILFRNGASSLLAASIGPGNLTIQVAPSDGAKYPSPGVGEYFVLALEDSNGAVEYCHCTSRVGDLLTVTRGQESTAAQTWVVNQARVELRNTAGQMSAMLQKTGDTMAGDLDMNGNDVQDSRLTGDTVVVGGQLVGTSIRGVEDDASNEIVVPSDGTRATAGGSRIVTLADNIMSLLPIGVVMQWFGSLGSLPTGWQLCDGTNGSPDMRDLFVRGAGGALALNATGGAASASVAGATDAGGGHTPVGVAAGHVLTEAEMPSHGHGLLGGTVGGGVTVDGPINNTLSRAVAGCRNSITPGPYDDDENSSGDPWIEFTGGGVGHEHAVTIDAVPNHTHTFASTVVATIPPYRALYFIMKVS